MTPDELERRLADVERRLARLEAGVVTPGTPASGPSPAARVGAPPQPVGFPMGKVPSRRPALSMPRLEVTFGLNWLSRIAVVTVVLALAFFFEYAFENHWITERGRLLLGLACGAAALGFGERMWRTGQRTFAQALTAAGIAFLYLSAWAAFALYHMVSATGAFVLLVLVTAIAGALALRYDASIAAMLGLGGGFATPLLLGHGIEPWFVLGYALVLDGGALVAGRVRRWRWLEALALAGTVVLYATQSDSASGHRVLFTLFALAFYGVFAASSLIAVFMAAQLLSGATLTAIWAPEWNGLVLAFAAAAAGLLVADRRRWPTAVTTSFLGFWLGYLIPANRPLWAAMGLLTASFAMFLGWALWRAYARKERLRLQDLTLVVLNAAFYFGASYALLEDAHSVIIGLFAVAVAAVHMTVARALWTLDQRGAVLAAGAAWTLLVLAVPIQFAGYRVTVAWAAEGAALAWIGVRLSRRAAIRGALAVFAMVVIRLAVSDSFLYNTSGSYAALANARFLAFAAAAAGLWASAWWVRTGRSAAVLYVSGHAVLLWGLCLEAVGWAGRTASPGNFRSFASASLSVLAGAYALVLVGGGSAKVHAPTRLLGMILIGIVVVKLYLYDVWLLGQFYRMAAFAILGIVLLVISYLFRPRSR